MSLAPSPRVGAFSLVELMVVVTIIGVLTAIALPRYRSMIAQARRGEAKSNLAHIASLQSLYKVEHWHNYYGYAMTGGRGVGHGGSCANPSTGDVGLNNHLGFTPYGCSALRYKYYLVQSSEKAFAYAASNADGKYIYPDCNGGGAEECNGYDHGDVVELALSDGKAVVCRNITKYCPTDLVRNTVPAHETPSTPPGTPPPTPPPGTNPCSGCSCGSWIRAPAPPSHRTDSDKYVCYNQQETQTTTDRRTCSLAPPGCVGGITQHSCRTTRNVNHNITVRGSKSIDNAAPIDNIHFCGCGGTPDPRAACRPPPPCDATASCCQGNTAIEQPTSGADASCERWTGTHPNCCKCVNERGEVEPVEPCLAPLSWSWDDCSCSIADDDRPDGDDPDGDDPDGDDPDGDDPDGDDPDGDDPDGDDPDGDDPDDDPTPDGGDATCTPSADSVTPGGVCCDPNGQAVPIPDCGEGRSWDSRNCRCDPVLPEPTDQSCTAAEQLASLLCISPNQWRGPPACECINYCPAQDKTVAQALVDCSADAGNAGETCPQAQFSHRFNSDNCRCIVPHCKYTQCVITAITQHIGRVNGDDVRLGEIGDKLRPCYRDGEESFNNTLKMAIMGTGETGGKKEMRKLLSTSNYGSCRNNPVPEALNTVKTTILDMSSCDGDNTRERVAFEDLDN